MRVMVMVKATEDSEAQRPSQRGAADGDGAVQRGAGEGWNHDRTVINGPFPQTTELVAGFWLWRVTSMDEAIEWVKRCPNPTGDESEIEIRPLFEADDFGAELTPELRQQEEQLRTEMAARE